MTSTESLRQLYDAKNPPTDGETTPIFDELFAETYGPDQPRIDLSGLFRSDLTAVMWWAGLGLALAVVSLLLIVGAQ